MDYYTNAFYSVVKETQEHTGYTLPNHIEAYVVMLLASKVDQPDFLPKGTFAESYMNNRSPKELGDTCLFVSGVFPSYGERKGLSRKYYKDIGRSSYASMRGEIFVELTTHFDLLSDFIELSSTPPKSLQSNLFR